VTVVLDAETDPPTLTEEVVYLGAGGEPTELEYVTFINRWPNAEVELIAEKKTIRKTMTKGLFRFELYEADEHGEALDDEAIETASNDEGGVSVSPVTFPTLKYTEADTVYYLIKEVPDSSGNWDCDPREYHIRAAITGTKTLTTKVEYRSRVAPDAWSEWADYEGGEDLTFVNDYITAPYTFRGKKTVEGPDAPEKTFYFTLVPLNSANPEDETGDGPYIFTMPSPNPLPVETDGEGDYLFEFSEIEGLMPNTDYYFKIVESDDGAGGWAYDAAPRVIVLHVNGDREAEIVEITDGEGGTSSLDFTNTYAPQPAQVTLNAAKTALGKDMEPGQFSFVIYNADDSGEPDGEEPVRTGTNTSGGDISDVLFITPDEPFEYTQEGTHYYLMEETGTDGAGWRLSKRQYLIKVEVTDDGEGHLSAEVTWGSKTPEDEGFPEEGEWEVYTESSGGSWPAFRNVYLADRLELGVPVMVRKSLAGIDETDRVFTFLIEQVADELGTPLEEEDERAEVSPTSLEITIAGEEMEDGSGMEYFTLADPDEKTYYFKVTELDDGSDDEWSYDGNTYIVIIEVFDAGGYLDSTETFIVLGETGTREDVHFINRFRNAGITFSFLKTDREGGALEGVEFAIYACGEGHGTHDLMVSDDPGCCWTEFDTAASDGDGRVEFPELLPTGSYMLVETRTNRGLQLPFGQWLVEVDTNAPEGEQIVITGVTDSNSPPPGFAPGTNGELTVINYPLFTMPRAGSLSMLLFTTGGVLMIGLAGFYGATTARGKKRRAQR